MLMIVIAMTHLSACLLPAALGACQVFSLRKVLPQAGCLLPWERPTSKAEPNCLTCRWVLLPVCVIQS